MRFAGIDIGSRTIELVVLEGSQFVESVVRRATSMFKRVSVKEPVLFAGGVARNPCMRHLLEEALDTHILVPENPQMLGALGAAILIGE